MPPHQTFAKKTQMRISITFFVAAVSMMLAMSSCVSTSIYTEPGIQPVEESMITKGYYWEKGKDPDTFSDADVRKLFDRAETQDRFDGERSEIYSSQLVWALTARLNPPMTVAARLPVGRGTIE